MPTSSQIVGWGYSHPKKWKCVGVLGGMPFSVNRRLTKPLYKLFGSENDTISLAAR